MHDALGDALVVEVRDLLAQDEVLEQRRAAQPGLQRVLVVGDRHALVGRQRLAAAVDARTRQRARRDRCRRAAGGLPVLAEAFASLSVLAAAAGAIAAADSPTGGCKAFLRPISDALLALWLRALASDWSSASRRAAASFTPAPGLDFERGDSAGGFLLLGMAEAPSCGWKGRWGNCRACGRQATLAAPSPCVHSKVLAMDQVDLAVAALQGEFSDLADVGEAARVVIRLLLAALLGGLLGFNREQHGKAAGLRTHMLVAMGCASFVMVPQLSGMEIADMSRVIQGVIAGIGFLGAGTIIKHQADKQIFGLTTAAGIWMTAAIGIACGLGRELTAIVTTLLAWMVLGAMQRWLESREDDGDSASQDS